MVMADSTRSELDARDPDGLERQIEATRAELARTIDSIADRVAPKNVARRSAEKVKEQAGHVMETVSGALRRDPESDDDEGGLPVPPAVLIGGAAAVVAVTATIIVIRRRRRR